MRHGGTAYDSGFTIGLVDNDSWALKALKDVIDAIDEANAVWSVSDGTIAVEWCLDESRRPDLLLLDMSLEGLQGPTVCRMIREKDGTMPILAMTSFTPDTYRNAARLAGAQGIAEKNLEGRIVEGIHGIRRCGVFGEGFETADAAHARIVNELGTVQSRLSDQEMAVLDRLSQGEPDARIASDLGISPNTVRKHLQNIKRKLGVSNRVQAVLMWLHGNDV